MVSAVTSGDIELVQWLMERLEMEPSKGMAEAAAKGHLGMIQWMYEQAYGLEEDGGVLLRAAEEGYMDIVRWIIDRDWANEELDTDDEYDNYNDDWLGAEYVIRESCHITSVGGEASLAIHAAVINGHLEIAKYLRARVDTPLSQEDKTREIRRAKSKLKELAGQLGNEHNGAEVSGKTMIKAAERGLLHVVKWLFMEYGSDPKLDIFGFFEVAEQEYHSAIDAAAGAGHLEIVQYLHEVGGEACAQAKLKQQDQPTKVDLFSSLWSEGSLQETPGCASGAMDSAAANGHLEIVRWLHQHRKEGCSTDAMALAAQNGHLEVVKWLHDNRKEGCTVKTMDEAARSGHLEVVKWLHEHRSEECTVRAMNEAAIGGHLDVVRWFHLNRHEGCTSAAIDGSASSGAFDVVKWLSCNRAEGCTTAALDKAARNGHIGVMRWLQEHRDEGCTTASMDNAALQCKFEALMFLHRNRQEGCTAAAILSSTSMEIRQWVSEKYPDVLGDDIEDNLPW